MGRRSRWTTWVLALTVATLLLYAVDIVFAPVPAGVSELFQKFAASAALFGAAALCVARGRKSPGERSAWWLFALAMALWGTGSVYFSIFLWNDAVPPYPSVADAFWLAFYVPAAAAFLRRQPVRASWGVRLDAVVCGLGVGGAGALLVFDAVLKNTSGSAIEIATNLAYPLADVGLLVIIGMFLTLTGWKAAGHWRWVMAAIAIFAVADSTYLVQVSEGHYVIGGVADLGWPLAACLVGLAAWRRPKHVATRRAAALPVIAPALFGFLALSLLVVDHFVRTTPIALVLATASIFIILIRLRFALRDNERMLVHSRAEATTDALTGLGNRRQLRADLDTHLDDLDPDHPLMLTLFDLDGFKQYNDTFGHLAGDQLLERLGARLRDVMADHGAAYRMGGDEFCALWTDAEADQASVRTMAAVAALSEQGEAFSIACSYGSVLMPNETSDPTDALRTADRRMYVRKGSGRASAGRQSADVLLRALSEADSLLDLEADGLAELACVTARALDVPEDEIEVTRQTALLRDVGKVAIPDGILSKPGPFNASDTAFIRRHTIIGERIISAAPALAAVARLVRSTHERYDGTGYPDGLAGEDIPKVSRIVAVCDAYEAMVSERGYRAAWHGARAIAELRRCAGTQFDPEVVEAFIGALETVRGPPMALAHP